MMLNKKMDYCSWNCLELHLQSWFGFGKKKGEAGVGGFEEFGNFHG